MKRNEDLGQMALAALSVVREDMLSAARGGDEWAAEWLVQVWDEFPVELRKALGDTEVSAL